MVAGVCLLAGAGAPVGHASTAGADEAAEAAVTQDAAPRDVVSALHEALIASMKAGREAGFEQRFGQLGPVIRAAFDMDLVARLVLGSHWSSLQPDQRRQFTQTLTRFTIANYASRFDQYTGQSFAIRSVKSQRPNLQVVRATLTVHPDKQHRFDYQLRQSDDRWRIVNVAVDGVSDLAIKRAQYVDVIEREGFAALISLLNDRIDTMAGHGADDE